MATPQGTALGPGRRVRRHLPDDVQEGRHRAVPRGEEAHRAALPRPAPAQPPARRAREVHRLRAVRVGLPGRRDLRRGRRRTPRTSASRPGERYGRVYQINYLRCIFCGLCIEACPTRALTMTNEYELADDNRADLIFEKNDLLAPLLPGMVAAAARDGRSATTTRDYYRGARHPERGRPTDRRARWRGSDRRLLGPGADHGRSPRSACCSSRKAVHAALLLAVVMICLAILYLVQGAPFLGRRADHRLHRRDHDAVPLRR